MNKLINISCQSLRGPRGGMIFFKKDPVLGIDLESAINNAVFPGLQVGILCFCSIAMNANYFTFFVKMDFLILICLHSKINITEFFSQGGPHNHTIGGLAVCLKYAQTPEFKAYQKQVLLVYVVHGQFEGHLVRILTNYTFCVRWFPTVEVLLLN